MVGGKRFAIDFDEAKSDALAWVLASETRKKLYKHREDSTIKALFEQQYGAIEEEADDIVPERIIVGDEDAERVRGKWIERMKERLTKRSTGKSIVSLDPMTLWLIGEVIYFLITWWLDNRRKRIRREFGS